jgi:hypothetical protein
LFKKGCCKYGSSLNDAKDVFGSFKLNIKSIINKLKQKYSSDTSQESGLIHLDYLKDLNEPFGKLQKLYEEFVETFF